MRRRHSIHFVRGTVKRLTDERTSSKRMFQSSNSSPLFYLSITSTKHLNLRLSLSSAGSGSRALCAKCNDTHSTGSRASEALVQRDALGAHPSGASAAAGARRDVAPVSSSVGVSAAAAAVQSSPVGSPGLGIPQTSGRAGNGGRLREADRAEVRRKYCYPSADVNVRSRELLSYASKTLF